ncbi:MAG: SDR family NAD(P)-dependent oxidoreductase [Bacteroidetes bacterium]|jgi:NADP-dependent 3-hydroxy acid dehydrogenase YdfG|nr:SDR family NAD(P)-dependent oxidoreductase [Bacteroidota bacterium]
MTQKIALITGATSGIGYATAKTFAQNGIDIIICGRRQERLDQLANELDKQVNIHKLVFDVSDRQAVFHAVESLPAEIQHIDILINNAGNAHGLAFSQDADLDDWDRMTDINLKGLTYVTKALLPGMTRYKSGHIINVGSIAGKEVYPKGNVYCATKHAVDAFTKGLRIDLNGTGIKVGAVNPGAVNTEFSAVRFKGDQDKADKVYEGFEPLVAQDIADVIYFMVSCPDHVNMADVTVLPKAQASVSITHKEI